LIPGNRVQNVVWIFRQGPGTSHRIIAGASHERVEAVRTLAGDFKTFVRIEDIDGGVISQVRGERAERELNFEVVWQRLDLAGPLGSLLILRAEC
jgi:hypothetical protein